MSLSKKLLVTALAVVFIASLASIGFAQGKAGGKVPKVVIVGSKTAVLGDILEGQDVLHTFKIKNMGSADLQILNVRPG
jgi:hypothetical protein